jgi:tripartite-type tricarboxylate transporter receptor subunit TctC
MVKRWPSIRSLMRVGALSLSICCAGMPFIASAATYPERPVTIVVPFAPGGANDVVVRIIQNPLAEALGQPVIVENRAGAGGNIGIGVVAHARPDGYTLLMAATGFAVNPSLYAKVPYDPLHDFDEVAELCTFPIVYAVRPDLGVSNLQELIALARAKPGTLNYSTPGIGTVPHLATELLKLDQHIDLQHVAYPGAAPAAQAILTRTVEIASMSVAVAEPLIESGILRGLAVSSPERWPELPSVPTVAEAGVPAATADTWQGIMLPTGTPADIRAKLEAALIEIVQRRETSDKLLHAGFRSTGKPARAFHERILRELPMWKDVIAKAHITPE